MCKVSIMLDYLHFPSMFFPRYPLVGGCNIRAHTKFIFLLVNSTGCGNKPTTILSPGQQSGMLVVCYRSSPGELYPCFIWTLHTAPDMLRTQQRLSLTPVLLSRCKCSGIAKDSVTINMYPVSLIPLFLI